MESYRSGHNEGRVVDRVLRSEYGAVNLGARFFDGDDVGGTVVCVGDELVLVRVGGTAHSAFRPFGFNNGRLSGSRECARGDQAEHESERHNEAENAFSHWFDLAFL